jgi:protein-tyrosine phosphatase
MPAKPLMFHPPIRTLLVLCEANHCRAPIAEGLLQAYLGASIQVASAGLRALEGVPADQTAARIMREHGFDISGHRGRQVTQEMACAADLILVMDGPQKEWCTQLAPSARGRIFLLGYWLSSPPLDIRDPFSQDDQVFREIFDDIRRASAAWVPHLLSEQRLA